MKSPYTKAVSEYSRRQQRHNPAWREGHVVSVRGNVALVRMTGGSNTQPAAISPGVEVRDGDVVALVSSKRDPHVRWTISSIVSRQNSHGGSHDSDWQQIHPPNNIRIKPNPNYSFVEWDAPVGVQVSFEVQVAEDGSGTNSQKALTTRGSYAIIASDYQWFRIRCLLDTGQPSRWTNWTGIPAFVDEELETVESNVTPSTSALIPLASVTPGTLIKQVHIVVEEAFDASPELSIGEAGTPERFMATDECDLSTAGHYTTSPAYVYTGTDEVRGYFTSNGATVGKARILVYF